MKSVCPNGKAVKKCWHIKLKDKKREKQDPIAYNLFLRLNSETGVGGFELHLHQMPGSFSLLNEKLVDGSMRSMTAES